MCSMFSMKIAEKWNRNNISKMLIFLISVFLCSVQFIKGKRFLVLYISQNIWEQNQISHDLTLLHSQSCGTYQHNLLPKKKVQGHWLAWHLLLEDRERNWLYIWLKISILRASLLLKKETLLMVPPFYFQSSQQSLQTPC